ncbi:MAG: 3-phosphoglycerate dehydrogenase family protein [Eubacteriales bacterium]|nr:3-phosphoglycerate dehydrogenase family protein [Eubacteriales bacterium]
MYKIATLNKISPAGLSQLGNEYTVTDDLASANGIIVRSADMHDMDFSDSLLAIARAGAGVNNIPLDKCAAQGIVVFNAPGANANAVKELVLAALLMSARNIPAAQAWANSLLDDPTIDINKEVEKGKGQFAGHELKGKTLGVIGLGAIGAHVANTASSLGMRVIGYDPFLSIKSAHLLNNDIPIVDELNELLPRCDYVSIHVPVSDDTRGMIDKRRIGEMKDHAVLLNLARGPLVNNEAVLEALESGKLKHYVTDFPNDKLLGKPGVIVTPHLGASTEEAEDNCATMAVHELMDYIENGNIGNSVNYPACSLGAKKKGTVRISMLHKNVPAVIGRLTGILADMNINISNMSNQSRKEYAYTLIDAEIDSSAELKQAVEKLGDLDPIIRIRVIQ